MFTFNILFIFAFGQSILSLFNNKSKIFSKHCYKIMIMKIKIFYIFSNTNRSINTHTNRQDLGISYLHIKSFSLVIIDRRNSRKVERNRGWNMCKQDQPWGKPKHWILPFWENGKQSYSEKGFQQVKHYFNKKRLKPLLPRSSRKTHHY